MKRLLKSFPVKSSSQSGENKFSETKENISIKFKEVVSEEIEQIKTKLNKPADEKVSEIKLLGALLKYLRESKSMTLLMLCRQIEKIEVKRGVAIVYSEDKGIEELVLNEKYKAEIDTFFKSQGLSFRLNENTREISAVDILNEMLGGKLVVK